MAFIKILICVALTLFAQTLGKPSSDQEWVFQQMKMANHNFPSLPFNPNLPSYTQLPVFNPFQAFPIREIELPSPADIANRKSDPEKDFSSIVLRETRSNLRDKKGKKIDSGGAVVMSNHNGNVEMAKAGPSPPDLNEEFVFPTIPKLESLFKDFHFEPLVFEPIKPIVFAPIVPINFDDIKEHAPGEGETYVAMGHSTHTSSVTVDGVTQTSGGEEKMVNDNGNVMHEKKGFGEKDKPKKN